MEIDRQTLLRLLEAFADTSEVLQRELMLYQSLLSGACKVKGLSEAGIEEVVKIGRERLYPAIAEASREAHQSLLEKLPQIVDLLEADQGGALRLLKEWNPKGLPN
jgi:hypothetical protein